MSTSKETLEQQLAVLRARGGDRDAMEFLVQKWEQRLFYFIRRLTNQESDAWDVLQSVWVRVFRGIGSLTRPEAFSCWLYTLARNTTYSHMRRRPPKSATRQELEFAKARREESDFEIQVDNVDLVHHSLARLSEAHSEVLTLFFLNDLSIAEIGEVVGLSEGTVKSRLHYAKTALRRVLDSEGVR